MTSVLGLVSSSAHFDALTFWPKTFGMTLDMVVRVVASSGAGGGFTRYAINKK
jgi:hypothetical protein